MDELMKQAEDHLAKCRVQIATDEAIHGIKNIAEDQSGASEVSLSQVSTEQWWFQELNGISGANKLTEDQYRGINIARLLIPRLIAALSSNAAQSAGQEHSYFTDEHGDGVEFQHPTYGSGVFFTEDCRKHGVTHPSSAAQVEEIRNAAIEEAALLVKSQADMFRGSEEQLGRMIHGALLTAVDNINTLKTAAPSKGEE